jgi:hypothetical protein
MKGKTFAIIKRCHRRYRALRARARTQVYQHSRNLTALRYDAHSHPLSAAAVFALARFLLLSYRGRPDGIGVHDSRYFWPLEGHFVSRIVTHRHFLLLSDKLGGWTRLHLTVIAGTGAGTATLPL